MATERSPEFAALLAKHQRTVNCLADPDRTTRKRALVKLRRAFVEDAEVRAVPVPTAPGPAPGRRARCSA